MKVQELADYRHLLGDIKARVRQVQHRAALSANAEMVRRYWDIGRMIAARQEREGWGAPQAGPGSQERTARGKGFFAQEFKTDGSVLPRLPRAPRNWATDRCPIDGVVGGGSWAAISCPASTPGCCIPPPRKCRSLRHFCRHSTSRHPQLCSSLLHNFSLSPIPMALS